MDDPKNRPKNTQMKLAIPANISIHGHAKRGVVIESFQSPKLS